MKEYVIKESVRARTLRIAVALDGSITVTKPVGVSLPQVERFVRAHAAWIETAREKMRTKAAKLAKRPRVELPRVRRGTRAYKEAIATARALASERVSYWSQIYGFPYGTISIRNQKSRWGSCTKAGNLSFNMRLIYLPPELLDYLIVHELCHTKEHNHSARFWALVASELPDHTSLRKKLRSFVF